MITTLSTQGGRRYTQIGSANSLVQKLRSIGESIGVDAADLPGRLKAILLFIGHIQSVHVFVGKVSPKSVSINREIELILGDGG